DCVGRYFSKVISGQATDPRWVGYIFSIVRAAPAHMDHRPHAGFVHAAADNLGEKDAMIERVDVTGRLAFQVAKRVLQNWHAAGTVRDLEAVESRLAWVKTLRKVPE